MTSLKDVILNNLMDRIKLQEETICPLIKRAKQLVEMCEIQGKTDPRLIACASNIENLSVSISCAMEVFTHRSFVSRPLNLEEEDKHAVKRQALIEEAANMLSKIDADLNKQPASDLKLYIAPAFSKFRPMVPLKDRSQWINNFVRDYLISRPSSDFNSAYTAAQQLVSGFPNFIPPKFHGLRMNNVVITVWDDVLIEGDLHRHTCDVILGNVVDVAGVEFTFAAQFKFEEPFKENQSRVSMRSEIYTIKLVKFIRFILEPKAVYAKRMIGRSDTPTNPVNRHLFEATDDTPEIVKLMITRIKNSRLTTKNFDFNMLYELKVEDSDPIIDMFVDRSIDKTYHLEIIDPRDSGGIQSMPNSMRVILLDGYVKALLENHCKENLSQIRHKVESVASDPTKTNIEITADINGTEFKTSFDVYTHQLVSNGGPFKDQYVESMVVQTIDFVNWRRHNNV